MEGETAVEGVVQAKKAVHSVGGRIGDRHNSGSTLSHLRTVRPTFGFWRTRYLRTNCCDGQPMLANNRMARRASAAAAAGTAAVGLAAMEVVALREGE